MGKRKGRQRNTEFTVFTDEEFVKRFYERRAQFSPEMRQKVEAEAKARAPAKYEKTTPIDPASCAAI
jgi:hypothetical protein